MTDLLAALRPVLVRAADWLKDQPELRQELAVAARAFADWADKGDPQPAPAVAPPTAVDSPAIAIPVVKPTLTPPPLPTAVPLTTPPIPAKPNFAPSFTPDSHREFVPLPLATVAQRCRIKAQAAKLMAKRAGGASVGETADEESKLRSQAEAMPDCGLWMFDPDGYARSKAVWDDLAGGFLVCSYAADLLRGWMSSGPELTAGQDTLTHAAEAQSMLLYAVADVGWVTRDHEQVQMFVHIRELGKQYQIYVPRFLRREDPADPARWPDLAERLKAKLPKYAGVLNANVAGSGAAPVPADPQKVRAKTLSNLKFKMKKLADDPNSLNDEWPRLVELLDQAVVAGVPPSSLDLRELILPVYDRIPDEVTFTPNAERVFRAIELFRDSQKDEPILEVDDATTPEVAKVATWLQNRELVMIGGVRRPKHVAALRRAFGLADVHWLSVPEHSSFTVFETDIARPEVAVVLLAIRWSSHDYAEVKQFCDKYNKPLVRLPGGYNAAQIAHQLAAQAGDRLAVAASNDTFTAGLHSRAANGVYSQRHPHTECAGDTREPQTVCTGYGIRRRCARATASADGVHGRHSRAADGVYGQRHPHTECAGDSREPHAGGEGRNAHFLTHAPATVSQSTPSPPIPPPGVTEP